MGETNPVEALVRETSSRLNEQMAGQGEQLEKLGQSFEELRRRHTQLEEAVQQELEAVAKAAPAVAAAGADAAFEKLLGSVRNLITATLPEQVFDVLAEEAAQMNVRAAVFDVRGKAAWGKSLRGFGSELPEKVLRAMAIPLNQDNPFRQAFETGGHVDPSADQLRKARNVFEKFKPSANDVILLLPIRSAGSVSALCYFDTGGQRDKLPVDALKILAEFAGAQLDRLMALGGGISFEAPPAESGEAPVAEAEPLPAEAEAVTADAERQEPAATESAVEAPPVESAPASPPAAPAAFDMANLAEEDQKVHKDAKRFAKLLVSEIELYNKTKVSDGRKNRDLYSRLKTDIERSRQTYEKRFGKTVAMQYDHFHEELVRSLAANDVSALGGDYPGPSV